jgi:hypothetical protein
MHASTVSSVIGNFVSVHLAERLVCTPLLWSLTYNNLLASRLTNVRSAQVWHTFQWTFSRRWHGRRGSGPAAPPSAQLSRPRCAGDAAQDHVLLCSSASCVLAGHCARRALVHNIDRCGPRRRCARKRGQLRAAQAGGVCCCCCRHVAQTRVL